MQQDSATRDNRAEMACTEERHWRAEKEERDRKVTQAWDDQLRVMQKQLEERRDDEIRHWRTEIVERERRTRVTNLHVCTDQDDPDAFLR